MSGRYYTTKGSGQDRVVTWWYEEYKSITLSCLSAWIWSRTLGDKMLEGALRQRLMAIGFTKEKGFFPTLRGSDTSIKRKRGRPKKTDGLITSKPVCIPKASIPTHNRSTRSSKDKKELVSGLVHKSVKQKSDGEPWICCGEHLPGDCLRCFKCKRWKGGERRS